MTKREKKVEQLLERYYDNSTKKNRVMLDKEHKKLIRDRESLIPKYIQEF